MARTTPSPRRRNSWTTNSPCSAGRPTGCSPPGKQRFSRDDFRAALRGGYEAHHGTRLDDSAERGLLDRFTGRGGIVVPAGSGDAAPLLFAHLTIQEYLTARHLSRLKNPPPPTGRLARLLQATARLAGYTPRTPQDVLLGRLWDHPDWRHAWELYAELGKETPGHINRMVATVMERRNRHPLDRHLHRHRATTLRWAGLCEWKHPPSGAAWREVLAWAEAALAAPGYGAGPRPRGRSAEWRTRLARSSRMRGACPARRPDSHVGNAAAWVLASQAGVPKLRKTLLARLRDREWRVRQDVAVAPELAGGCGGGLGRTTQSARRREPCSQRDGYGSAGVTDSGAGGPSGLNRLARRRNRPDRFNINRCGRLGGDGAGCSRPEGPGRRG